MTRTRTDQTAGVTIRPAYADDDVAVRRLAALDSAPIPKQPLLLAEADGRLLAAVSLRNGAVIADPFEPTADVVALLELRAHQQIRRQARQPADPRGREARLRAPAAPAGRLRPLRSRA